ncbi:MAG: 5' nucleotidase, NT5C type [Proteocatella sp.]
MKKYNIGIDIDGTLTYSGYFLPYLNEYFGKDVGYEDLIKYDFRDIYDVTDEEINTFFHSEGRNLIFKVDILDGARETVLELAEKHNVWIITARKPETHDRTKLWLEENGLGNIELITLGTPDKLGKARELGCEIFIEDHPEASVDIAEAGIKLYLVDAPYNQDSNHENIVRVKDWDEIRTIFKEEGIL